jgi:hypothetical protein
MNLNDLQEKIQLIVKESTELKNKHTNEINSPVNYVCIFSHTQEEFGTLLNLVRKIGKIVENTSTGPIFKINTISTISGELKLLKIRKPYEDRPELGYSDFTLTNYSNFKEKYLSKKGFKLIERPDYEMIEIIDNNFNVLTYFANPPLDKQLNIQ